MSKTYEADFYTWAISQADAARRRSANEVDWDNVAEELESLARSEFRELRLETPRPLPRRIAKRVGGCQARPNSI